LTRQPFGVAEDQVAACDALQRAPPLAEVDRTLRGLQCLRRFAGEIAGESKHVVPDEILRIVRIKREPVLKRLDRNPAARVR